MLDVGGALVLGWRFGELKFKALYGDCKYHIECL